MKQVKDHHSHHHQKEKKTESLSCEGIFPSNMNIIMLYHHGRKWNGRRSAWKNWWWNRVISFSSSSTRTRTLFLPTLHPFSVTSFSRSCSSSYITVRRREWFLSIRSSRKMMYCLTSSMITSTASFILILIILIQYLESTKIVKSPPSSSSSLTAKQIKSSSRKLPSPLLNNINPKTASPRNVKIKYGSLRGFVINLTDDLTEYDGYEDLINITRDYSRRRFNISKSSPEHSSSPKLNNSMIQSRQVLNPNVNFTSGGVINMKKIMMNGKEEEDDEDDENFKEDSNSSTDRRSPHPKVKKRNQPAVEIFLGVPYASPPIGSLRFMPPVTPIYWKGVKLVNEFAPVCPQNIILSDRFNGRKSPDILYNDEPEPKVDTAMMADDSDIDFSETFGHTTRNNNHHRYYNQLLAELNTVTEDMEEKEHSPASQSSSSGRVTISLQSLSPTGVKNTVEENNSRKNDSNISSSLSSSSGASIPSDYFGTSSNVGSIPLTPSSPASSYDLDSNDQPIIMTMMEELQNDEGARTAGRNVSIDEDYLRKWLIKAHNNSLKSSHGLGSPKTVPPSPPSSASQNFLSNQSEDCLFLNIYCPFSYDGEFTTPCALMYGAVMLWIMAHKRDQKVSWGSRSSCYVKKKGLNVAKRRMTTTIM